MSDQRASLSEAHATSLRAFCAAQLRGFSEAEIEAAVEEALARALRAAEHPSEPLVYELAAARCAELRRERHDVLAEEGLFEPFSGARWVLTHHLSDAERDVILTEAARRVLAPDEQEIVRLRLVLAWPLEDVAIQLDRPAAEVRAALGRCRARLEADIVRRLEAIGYGRFLRPRVPRTVPRPFPSPPEPPDPARHAEAIRRWRREALDAVEFAPRGHQRAARLLQVVLATTWSDALAAWADRGPYALRPFPPSDPDRAPGDDCRALLAWRAAVAELVDDVWDLTGEPALTLAECRWLGGWLVPVDARERCPLCLERFAAERRHPDHHACALRRAVPSRPPAWPDPSGG